MSPRRLRRCFFFFNDTATTEIYTLSLHDALPILMVGQVAELGGADKGEVGRVEHHDGPIDRKSTRLNSSHGYISYAVFCLKKKKNYSAPGSTKRALTAFSYRAYTPSCRVHATI